jgi:hypothetical protein
VSADDEGRAGTIPTRTVHDAYRQCLQARQAYNDQRGRGARQEALHRRLHNAVYVYFEALRPVLVGGDAVDDYWEGSEDHHLWAKPALRVDTGDGEELVTEEQLARLDGELTAQVKQRGEQTTVYEGLAAIDGEFNRVQRAREEYADATGRHATTTQRAEPLPVEVLLAAARLLDGAAQELDLLYSVSESTPRTEITDEMIEEVEEWRKQNV